MFDLKRLAHMGRSTRQPASEPTRRTLALAEPVKLVAITENPEDSETLRQIAASYGWRISIVGSSDAAMALLKEQPTPLVICDRDLSGEAWPEVLAKVATGCLHPARLPRDGRLPVAPSDPPSRLRCGREALSARGTAPRGNLRLVMARLGPPA